MQRELDCRAGRMPVARGVPFRAEEGLTWDLEERTKSTLLSLAGPSWSYLPRVPSALCLCSHPFCILLLTLEFHEVSGCHDSCLCSASSVHWVDFELQSLPLRVAGGQ